jgi:hypothetical protein
MNKYRRTRCSLILRTLDRALDAGKRAFECFDVGVNNEGADCRADDRGIVAGSQSTPMCPPISTYGTIAATRTMATPAITTMIRSP